MTKLSDLTADTATTVDDLLYVVDGVSLATRKATVATLFGTYLDTDTALAANSDVKIATQKAVKTYVDSVSVGIPTVTTNDTGTWPVTTVGGVTTIDLSAAASVGSADFSSALFTVHDSVDSTKKVAFSASPITTATTRTITVPDASDTMALLAATQTFTNKTLTRPVITSGVIAPSTTAPAANSQTYTAFGYGALSAGLSTVWTLNFANAAIPGAIQWAPYVDYLQAGQTNVGGLTGIHFVNHAATYSNDPTVAVGFSASTVAPAGRIFADEGIIQADTQSIGAGGWTSFRAGATFQIVNAGVITAGSYQGLVFAPTFGAGVTLGTVNGCASTPTVAGTITTLTAYKVSAPTITGTVTTMYGLDIAASLGAATSVGIRNLSSLRQVAAMTLGSDAAARTGLLFDQAAEGGFALNPATSLTYASPTSVDTTKGPLFKVTTVNATGSVTFNASSGGVDGQVMIIRITNDATSGKTITFGTNFKPSGTLVGTISKVCQITFVSDGTNWYEQNRAGAAGGTAGM